MTSSHDLSNLSNLAVFGRPSLSSSVILALGFASVFAACGSSDGGASGTGGASSSSGGSSASGSGGATSSGSGGTSVNGSGGSSSSTGGASSSGSGGSTTNGSGGTTTTGSGGTASSGSGGSGSTGSGGSGAALPACTTQAKGGACISATDACAKTCGPKSAANVSVGSKSETCTGGTYVEGTCEFPAGDYACFKVTATTAACPAQTTASAACTATSCVPCSGYNDSSGAAKVGYCHCVNSKWSCGSTKEWPCQTTGTSTSPGGTGC